MDIVIVTCLLDRLQFLIQCRTIGMYLEPCKISIVLNEYNKDLTLLSEWINRTCLKYLYRHSVTVYSSDDIANVRHIFSGWKRQQLLKLFYSKKVDGEYCVLDSKNWFVNNCTTDMLRERRPEKRKYIPPTLPDILIYLNRKFKFKYPGISQVSNSIHPIETPFLIKSKIVDLIFKSFKGEDNFIKVFDQYKTPSEFMIYSIFKECSEKSEKNYVMNEISKTIWPLDFEGNNIVDTWVDYQNCGKFKLLGIHKDIIKKISIEEFEKIINTLCLSMDDEVQEILNSKIKNQNVPTLK